MDQPITVPDVYYVDFSPFKGVSIYCVRRCTTLAPLQLRAQTACPGSMAPGGRGRHCPCRGRAQWSTHQAAALSKRLKIKHLCIPNGLASL